MMKRTIPRHVHNYYMEIGDLVVYKPTLRDMHDNPIGVVVRLSLTDSQVRVYWLDVGLYSWVFRSNLESLCE